MKIKNVDTDKKDNTIGTDADAAVGVVCTLLGVYFISNPFMGDA
jgi:hypothetical protein